MHAKMRIQRATGKAKCKYCHTKTGKDVVEVVGNLGTGNYEGHYHLRRTKLIRPGRHDDEECPGFIELEWESFVDPLVSSLTEEELQRLGLQIV